VTVHASQLRSDRAFSGGSPVLLTSEMRAAASPKTSHLEIARLAPEQPRLVLDPELGIDRLCLGQPEPA
jgi:hypothetical protein